MTSTPTRHAPAVSGVHELDDGGQDARVGLGQDAVAEVEDVARCRLPRPRLASTARVGLLDHGPRRQAQGGVEVALQGVAGTDAPPGLVERHAPVDADHVGPGRRHRGPAARRYPPRRGWSGTPRSATPVEDRAGRGQREALVLGRGQRPGPAVEELHGLGAGLDLGPQRGHRHGGQPVRQLLPQRRVAVHQRLHLGEGARRAALDQRSWPR